MLFMSEEGNCEMETHLGSISPIGNGVQIMLFRPYNDIMETMGILCCFIKKGDN